MTRADEDTPDINAEDDGNGSRSDGPPEQQEPEPASEEVAPATTPSATLHHLQNRLLTQQRSNILLQMLFHHMLNTRRRRRQEEAAQPPPLPDRPMPVLSHQEAVDTSAMCRFCFDGSTEQEEEQEEQQQQQQQNTAITSTTTRKRRKNLLVAPCNCAGGSRWVHLECLQQWQRLQVRAHSPSLVDDSSYSNNNSTTTTTSYTTAGYVCNVCNSPYLSRPPSVRMVRRNLLKRGTLLVSKQTVGRTFQNTVVLLLNNNIHTRRVSDATSLGGGAFGVIINAPLEERSIPGQFIRDAGSTTEHDNTGGTDEEEEQQNNCNNNDGVNADAGETNNSNSRVEWRRGGPVCGGRLGVVHYTILHTYPPNGLFLGQGDGDEEEDDDDVLDVDIDEEYFEEDSHDNDVNVPLVDNIQLQMRAADAPTDSDDGYDDNDDERANRSHVNSEDDDAVNYDDDDNDDDDVTPADAENELCSAPFSLPVFDFARNNPPIHFVASPDTQDHPATFSEESLGRIVPRLVTSSSSSSPPHHPEPSSSSSSSIIAEEADATVDDPPSLSAQVPLQSIQTVAATTTTTTTATINDDDNAEVEGESQDKVIVFMGYCKWRAGQLQREIQRELWDVCVDATPADILRHHSTGLWEEISESERLLSWQQLIEEEDDDDDDREVR